MTERKRLIELVKQSLIKHIDKTCKLAENITEDLLANGIRVPPVKIGDTIYVPRKDGFSAKKVEKIEMFENITLIGFGWRGCGYEMVSASDVGKAFFLTPEDAERAQAERSKP